MEINIPLISIIIPVYNVEKYLRQCMDSVLEQSYPNIEVVLVDDGSKDSSGIICDEYAAKDNRVKVIHKANGGLSDARNIGLESSTGELITYIDSDDYWAADNCLERIINLFYSNNRKKDFLIYNYSQFYQVDDRIIKNRSYNSCSGSNKYEKLSSFANTGNFPMQAWTKLVRRKFLIKNNISFIQGIIAEDIPWFIELVNKCDDFMVVNEYVAIYRKQVENAITSRFSYKKFDDLIFVVDSCIKKAQAGEYDEKLLDSIYTFMAYEYAILIAKLANVDAKRKAKYMAWFRQYKWLLKYSNNKKNNLVKCCVNYLGFNITSRILRFYIVFFVNKN